MALASQGHFIEVVWHAVQNIMLLFVSRVHGRREESIEYPYIHYALR